MKRLLTQPAMQALMARLLGLYLSFALRTTRWRLDGVEHVLPHMDGESVIAAFWHERLPLMPALWLLTRRHRARSHQSAPSVKVLVSHHRDGRFVGAVVRRFGVEVVLGSTSRGGAAGLRTMFGLLRKGEHIGITPDGPRGPRRKAAPGVAQLAALAGIKVLPCGAQTSRVRVLKTWDRMVLPLPFGRGVIVCGAPILVPRAGWEAAVPVIAAAITDATERADALCAA